LITDRLQIKDDSLIQGKDGMLSWGLEFGIWVLGLGFGICDFDLLLLTFSFFLLTFAFCLSHPAFPLHLTVKRPLTFFICHRLTYLQEKHTMKNKIMILAVVFTYSLTNINAQTSDAEAEAVINLLGVQKKEAISRMVAVSSKDSVTFWKLYDEYQQSNKATAKSRMRLYERTGQAYNNMTPAIADSLATSYFKNRSEQEKSLEAYYKKMKAATNAVTAFEFYQAEVYLLTSIRASIMQQIPTYGEVQRSGKKPNKE
jgi:hypothetical protein